MMYERNHIELVPLYEKMLSTIPKEKVIMTKSDIFDEGDNLISSGMFRYSEKTIE